METSTFFLYAAQVIAAAVASLFAAWLLRSTNQTTKPNQPVKWPLIGHLHLLMGGAAAPLHAKLAALADRYGSVMLLQLGWYRTLVVSDAVTAKECFTTNDLVFASRPRMMAAEIFGLDFTNVAWAPYGELWRNIRKICTLQLLSGRRLEALAHIRDEETSSSIKDLHRLCSEEKGGRAVVEMRGHLSDLVLRVIMRMLAGRSSSSFGRDEEAKELKEVTDKAFILAGLSTIGDSLPSTLKWVDPQGTQRAMRRLVTKMKEIAQSWIDRRREMMEREEKGCGENADFLDILLSAVGDDQYLSSLSSSRQNLVIIATLLTMVTAAIDTTSVTLEWALSYVLSHPGVLKRLQVELDNGVGRERRVEESDIQNLVYLQAVVKETMRLHPAGPLLIPHESTEDCVVAGSHIPAGTRLIVNAWKIHRDPKTWKRPLEFEPERFLGESADVDVRGRYFQLIPFGSGRRSCPGTSLALSVLHLSLARIVHSFNLLIPHGEPSTVDMREGPGLTSPKLVPLKVLLIPRLPSQLY